MALKSEKMTTDKSTQKRELGEPEDEGVREKFRMAMCAHDEGYY